ncbi:MAG: hypothetical protein WCT04_15720 [Planctomycetota bacterium]
MAKVSYDALVLKSIIAAATGAREAGKTWNDAFACAQQAGYKGSVSSLQKLVRAHLAIATVSAPAKKKESVRLPAAKSSGGAPNRKKVQPAGFKNTTKSAEVATGNSKAFSKAKPAKNPGKSLSPSASPHVTETLESIQNRLPVLRDGTHYARPISLFDGSFHQPNAGELVAWSRILGKEEAVCVTNSHDQHPRGADVLVDSTLNPPGTFLTVIHSAASYAVGTQVPVQRRHDGTAFVAIRDVEPSATLVLSNAPGV